MEEVIKYTGFRDRPHEERQARFQNACRDGRSEIAFVATGTNLSLQFFPASWQGEQRQAPTREYVDFEREGGKVYLKAPMILNGVCVIWKGWIDLQRLDGMGCLEFDEDRAQQEDALAQQAFEEARRRTREFEDRDRSHREEMEMLPFYAILFGPNALHYTLVAQSSILDVQMMDTPEFGCYVHHVTCWQGRWCNMDLLSFSIHPHLSHYPHPFPPFPRLESLPQEKEAQQSDRQKPERAWQGCEEKRRVRIRN
ncbi:Core-binding factor subunit beta [Varanus komodoensis]|nr:Core-binding factor subunit beta [Varanus komodoensis]